MTIAYVTRKEFGKEFGDSLELLMNEMTIFMPMDGCPSPCNICALDAKKKVNLVMDFNLIESLYVEFTKIFDRNQPNEFANDQLAYKGSKGETYVDILTLQRDVLSHYPRIKTAMPRGAESVLVQILNFNFNSPNHPAKEGAQLVVPQISRIEKNKKIVNRFLIELESSDIFVEKESYERGLQKGVTYFLRTDYGVRKLVVQDITPVPIGEAAKWWTNPGFNGYLMYGLSIPYGIAVLPSGFYHFMPSDYSLKSLIRRPIHKKDLPLIIKRNDSMTNVIYDIEARKSFTVSMSRREYNKLW